MKFERNVAFSMVRIAFMLSDATGTSVASREGEGSRALLFENEFVSKTLPGYAFLASRVFELFENVRNTG